MVAGKHVYEAQSGSGGGGGGYAATAGYVTTIGDGANVTYVVTHALNTWDVLVQVYDLGVSPAELVDATVVISGANTVTITFDTIAAIDQYRVMVLAVNVGIANTMIVKEADGTPSVAADTIIFPNGSVTDNGDGSVSVVFLTTLANHAHAGVAGDGGTFDASNLTSGAAPIGHVLTADGAGESVWQACAGGGGYWEPLANGIEATPELIFSCGDVIMVEVTW